jgi:hypothetical protein
LSQRDTNIQESHSSDLKKEKGACNHPPHLSFARLLAEGVKIQTKINKTNHQKIPSTSPPIALLSTPKKF